MEQTAASTMGKRICRSRKRLGLTQDQLAEKLGVSPQAVSKWENDQSCPDVSLLPKLAEIFGITTDQLLGVAPEEAPEAPSYQESEENEPQGLHFRNGHLDIQIGPGKAGALSFALWLIAMGAMLLAGHFLKRDIGFWTALWTTGIAALGLNILLSRFNWFGLTCLLAGIYLALNALTLIPSFLTWDMVIPALLVICGISLLVEAFTGKRNRKSEGVPTSTRVAVVADGYLKYSHSFGDDQYMVYTPELKGGDISLSRGDHVIDLTGCQAVVPGCQLNIDSSMGDLVLRVPRRFQVEWSGDTALADVEIHGHPDTEPKGTLSINARISLGDLVIEYA